MPPDAERALRADAARNVKRLLDAARAVFAEQGPDAPLEAVAERAGVGVRTLFRHFPHKEALVRAALRQTVTERLPPILYRTPDFDPRAAIQVVMEAVLVIVERERNTLAAAANPAALTAEVIEPARAPLAALAEQAKAAGTMRPDVTGDDVARVLGLLTNVLWVMPEGDDGWRRYLVLVLDAFDPGGASPLPPPT
ncbi:helix-turn-helix domain-containing protein [Glycomyces sp. NPDC047010]|uniref:TetR/AcrR family transcriptional regulator n=1 Tax=Glycomyces sp. NPDC047010 TaxID=3155023 RepID=UPI003411F6AA